MDVTEKWGDSIDSAVKLALDDLKCNRDEVEIEVLEQPSRGFFGIGSRLALVRVSKKQPEPAPEPVKSEPVKAPAPKEAPVEAQVAEEAPVKEEAPKIPEEQKPQKSRERRRKRAGKGEKKNAKQAQPKAAKAPKVVEEVKNPMKELPLVEDHLALSFLKEVTEQMGLFINMTCRADDTNVYVEIEGPDSGTIIGKRGQTLDAIQYLTSLVVNKEQDNYIKVVVDAENYRAKRERTLVQLANKLAGKVARTKKTVRLEPMNPYERKVIHATLQDDPRVTTRSEGQDPYRRVIIELK